MINEGTLDRAVRVIVGLAVLSLTVIGPHTLWGLIGAVPLLSGISGFCPLYRLLGIRTCAAAPSRASQAP
jgi:hypothetical protein